jgi:MFS family permease
METSMSESAVTPQSAALRIRRAIVTRGNVAGLGKFATIVLPFAAGYFLSYLFRTINALIAPVLAANFGLQASQLGLMTGVYFLSFAVLQIPAGYCLDRYGPRRVQVPLLTVAALGAATFSLSSGMTGLLIGRAMIGAGVAGSLVAGLKAITLAYPQDQRPVVNGAFIMLGTLGAVCATYPAETTLHNIDWRTLFAILSALSLLSSAAIFRFVPEMPVDETVAVRPIEVLRVYTSKDFWRLAPASVMCISTSWALTGLWAAPWLDDVAHLNRRSVVFGLFSMSVALAVSAVSLGVLTSYLQKRGMHARTLLAVVLALFAAAELHLILDASPATAVSWMVIGGCGAATVISYSAIAELFSKEISGIANAALNTLHISGAFVMQAGTGVIVGFWTPHAGHYPVQAYEFAFAMNIVIQLASLFWLLRPVASRTITSTMPSA